MKTAFDFVIEKARHIARDDSKTADSWEAVEDAASLKLTLNFEHYFTNAVAEYLKTQPYPTYKDTPQ